MTKASKCLAKFQFAQTGKPTVTYRPGDLLEGPALDHAVQFGFAEARAEAPTPEAAVDLTPPPAEPFLHDDGDDLA